MTLSILLAASAAFLTAEYQQDPVGIDTPSPRLSWKLPEGVVSQSAFQISTGDWTSRRFESARSVNVAWGDLAAPQLKTGDRISWRVKIWDEAGKELDWSAPASFTMGVMAPQDWKAKWIGPDPSTQPEVNFGDAEWVTGPHDKDGKFILTKTFTLEKLNDRDYVELLYLADPTCDLKINNDKVIAFNGHAPNWRFVKTVDLGPYMKEGTNTVEFTVWDRFHHSRTPRHFIARINLPNGQSLFSDETWGGKDVKSLGKLKDAAFVQNERLSLRMEAISPAFEKTFYVKEDVKKATLFITGLGFYEASLNGSRIGEKVLDPTPSEYDHHIFYSTYPLEKQLKKGENTLKVLLGHSYYDVRSTASWDMNTAPWRNPPCMIAQLDVEYVDGSTQRIVSDREWLEVGSPVYYDCFREGEVIGPAPLPPTGLKALEVPPPEGKLVAENHPGAEIVRELKPLYAREVEPGLYEVKFPENFAGWARLEFEGQKEGDVVSIAYDERSQEEINADPRKRYIDWHYRSSSSYKFCAKDAGFQTDRFYCLGVGDVYEPRFTYNGFQYLHIKGLRQAPKEVTGCLVRTNYRQIGHIETSDLALNSLLRAAERSYASNFADGYPTDCPHREKNGWTGDAYIASELAQYLCENTAAYEDWLMTLTDTENAQGTISCIAPAGGWGYFWGNGPSYDVALAIISLNLYNYREDRAILDRIYSCLTHDLSYTATKADADGLVSHGLGDWVPTVPDHAPTVTYTSSCYYYLSLSTAAEIARLQGNAAEEAIWHALAEKTRQSINKRFYKGNGVYDNGGQSAQGFAFAFGVYEPSERKAVEEKLVESVEKVDCRLDMGLYGTKWVFRSLGEIGRADLMYRMLVKTGSPTMLEWLQKSDGGTLWEDWDVGQSRNHIMFGDFYACAYQYLAGIRLPEREGSTLAFRKPVLRGFKQVLFAPSAPEGLDGVTASVDSPYGVYSSSWKRENGKVSYTFVVPAGGSAILRLPGKPDEKVGPGTWNR